MLGFLVLGSAGWLDLLPFFDFPLRSAPFSVTLDGWPTCPWPEEFFWRSFFSACVNWSICALWHMFCSASRFSMIPRILEGFSADSYSTAIITSSLAFSYFFFSRNPLRIILTFLSDSFLNFPAQTWRVISGRVLVSESAIVWMS